MSFIDSITLEKYFNNINNIFIVLLKNETLKIEDFLNNEDSIIYLKNNENSALKSL